MKNKIIVLIISIISFESRDCLSQHHSDTLSITYSKTTSLVFEYPIINVDRGSKDVIAQKVNDVDNALQIKAARKSFPETNLTVITADGNLHHFYVNYSDAPLLQTFQIYPTNVDVRLNKRLNAQEFEVKTARIKNHKRRALTRKSQYKIKFSLNEIYVDDDVLFYEVQIKNSSNINYDIQSLRFFIRDKQKLKRTASQEDELLPLYIRDKSSKINGRTSVHIIYALEKFTIPNAKTLDIELFEKNGGRNLRLRIDNQTIMKAEPLP